MRNAQRFRKLALPLPLVGTVAPQQAGEIFAGGGLLWTQGQEGEQSADLPGGKGYRRSARLIMSSDKSAAHTQDEAVPSHHLLRTNIPAPLLQCTGRRSKDVPVTS